MLRWRVFFARSPAVSRASPPGVGCGAPPQSTDLNPKLSIVATLYRSAETLEEFHRRSMAAADQLTDAVELVLVNDGSPDDSLALALELQRRDDRIRVVDLSRNFGHHKAMMAGLAHARGDLVFLIDSDLEERPELLVEFHRRLLDSAADVVYGVQERRKGGWLERSSGRLFFWSFNLLSETKLPTNLATVRLMTRRYVDSLLLHRERETIIAGLWALAGYQQLPIAIQKEWRRRSSYGWRQKAAALVNAVTSFSDRPLVLIFYLGSLILCGSVLAAVRLTFRKFVHGFNVVGWPSLMVSIWLLGGLTLFCIGVIGIYLSRVFIETKQRPAVIVRQVHEAPAPRAARGETAEGAGVIPSGS